jgi:hypothetical protein
MKIKPCLIIILLYATLYPVEAGFNVLTHDGAKAYIEVCFERPLGYVDDIDIYGRFPEVSFILLDNAAGQYEPTLKRVVIKVVVSIRKGYGYTTGPFNGFVSVQPDGKWWALDIQFDNSGHVSRFIRLPLHQKQNPQ